MAEALYINIPSNVNRRSDDIHMYIPTYSEAVFIARQRRLFIFHTTFIIVLFLTLLGVVIWLGIQYT